jgi:hypothetical protein
LKIKDHFWQHFYSLFPSFLALGSGDNPVNQRHLLLIGPNAAKPGVGGSAQAADKLALAKQLASKLQQKFVSKDQNQMVRFD